MTYIHELDSWPNFTWSLKALTKILARVCHRQGYLVGRMEALGFELRAEASLKTLTEDVLKTSEIEGETLDKEQVRSSVARRLGMDIAGLKPSYGKVDAVVEMMLDATQQYTQPLSVTRLYSWHSTLFAEGGPQIKIGKWRDDKAGPMQVISGPMGRAKVHFQAPAASLIPGQMKAFLKWFNSKDTADDLLKAAISHLWFVTIHPFDDGNGRIARAIADMVLARSDQNSQRFYSMSSQIQIERKAYYDILEATQKGDLDITDWLTWFLECIDRAFTNTDTTLSDVLKKVSFWDKYKAESFNDRQRIILNRVFDGFLGKLTSSKWAKLGKCSQDTANRDITNLIERGILTQNPGGGRSTSYSLTTLKG